MRTPRWAAIKCLGVGDNSKRAAYLDRPLLPLTGAPLVVFSKLYCTRRKVELVMKVAMGRCSFEVRTVGGEPMFEVGRRSLHSWNQRFIYNLDGNAICYVERVPNGSSQGVDIRVMSLEGPQPRVVLEARKSKSSLSKKEELRATIKGSKDSRCHLQFHGDLKRRMYGISWGDSPRSTGNMITMAWSVTNGGPADSCDAQYVLELPAGVDQALVLALAVLIEEIDAPARPPSVTRLEPFQSLPVGAFGKDFVTKEDDVFALAMNNELLSIMDSSGVPMLTCSEDGMFKTMEEKPVFQLTEGGFRAQGTTSGNKLVDVSFLELMGDGLSVRIALECACLSSRGCNLLLIVEMKHGETSVPIRLMSRVRTKKSTDSRKSASNHRQDGSIVARAVLGSPCPQQFEQWYHDAVEQLSCPRKLNDKTMEHVGIGVEVAAGVDVALIFAVILIAIKFLPTAFAAETTSGSIRPQGQYNLRKADSRDKLYEKSVTSVLEGYGQQGSESDFLLSSNREELKDLGRSEGEGQTV